LEFVSPSADTRSRRLSQNETALGLTKELREAADYRLAAVSVTVGLSWRGWLWDDSARWSTRPVWFCPDHSAWWPVGRM